MEFKGTKEKLKTPCGAVSGTNQSLPNNAIFAGEIKIAQVFGRTIEEANANTKLFAKAPEMLEMLKVARDKFLDLKYEHDSSLKDIQWEIEELIKSATDLNH